jgi:hypothetical protein
MPEAFTMPNQIAKTTADKIYQGIVYRYGVTEGSEVNAWYRGTKAKMSTW